MPEITIGPTIFLKSELVVHIIPNLKIYNNLISLFIYLFCKKIIKIIKIRLEISIGPKY